MLAPLCLLAALAQDAAPARVVVTLSAGEAGWAGGPVEARLEPGAHAGAVAARAVEPRAFPVQVDVEGGARVLRWVAAPLAPGEARRVAVELGGDAPDDVLRFVDADGGRDVVLGDARLARYVRGHDPERYRETFKTYHHLADLDGATWITKGLGGRYGHHRGLFVGWSRVWTPTNRLDVWAGDPGSRARQVAVEPARDVERAGPWRARQVRRVAWLGGEADRALDERRTLDVWRPAGGRAFFDVEVALTASGDVELRGDPAHAGVQVRLDPAHVPDGATYVRPADAAEHPFDADTTAARWTAARLEVGGAPRTLLHLAHPDNPGGTPAYNARAYGRFGAFAEHVLEDGETLRLRYRLVLLDGTPDAGALEGHWRAWTEPPRVAVERAR